MMKLDKEQTNALFKRGFPESKSYVSEVADNSVTMCLPVDNSHLRPGATVSGPVMMTMADAAMWAAVIALKGEQGFNSVTASLSINFLSRPKPTDLIVKAEVLKPGNRLIVGEVRIYSEGCDTLVAVATVTYAVAS